MNIDSLIEFITFDESNGIAVLGTEPLVQVIKKCGSFYLKENGKDVAIISDDFHVIMDEKYLI